MGIEPHPVPKDPPAAHPTWCDPAWCEIGRVDDLAEHRSAPIEIPSKYPPRVTVWLAQPSEPADGPAVYVILRWSEADRLGEVADAGTFTFGLNRARLLARGIDDLIGRAGS